MEAIKVTLVNIVQSTTAGTLTFNGKFNGKDFVAAIQFPEANDVREFQHGKEYSLDIKLTHNANEKESSTS